MVQNRRDGLALEGTLPEPHPIARARALMAEHHQPVAMSHAELWALLARYQKSLHQLLELAGPDGAEPGGAQADAPAAPVAGPLETERQAWELPTVRAVYEAFRASRESAGWHRTTTGCWRQRARLPVLNSARSITGFCCGWLASSPRRAR
jgi:hypothetical protein